MIDTVLFDMGGTLEDIYVDEASKAASASKSHIGWGSTSKP